jgi:diguanylate cyclase (GGDEF)-like protein/PAS domain S-box-containing protein
MHRRPYSERLFAEIDSMILAGESLHAILHFIASRLVSMYRYPLVQVSLRGQKGAVSIVTAAGRELEFLRDVIVRWDDTPEGRGPTGAALRTGIRQTCDVATDDRFELWRHRALAHKLRSVLAMPLVAGDRILGAITFFSTRRGDFPPARIDILQAVAAQAALSILSAYDNAQIRLQKVALESVANAVVITDTHGVIEWVNPAFTKLTGYSPEEAIGATPRLLRSGNHSNLFYTRMWETLLAGEVWHGEMYNRRRDGTVYAEEQTITPVRDEHRRITHFVAVKQDITERKQQEERIRHLALHDSLTNLPNRRAFDAMIRRIAHRGGPAALLVIDIDDFKFVNDSGGHPVGDQLLSEIGQLLQKQLRPFDFLARLGGDEFVALLENVSTAETQTIAERLRQSVEAFWFEREGSVLHTTVSVGVAPIDDSADPKIFISRADAALYAAKERGKNRVVTYPFGDEEDLGRRLADVTHYVTLIRTALRDGMFELSYQPVIRLGDGERVHYEALVRMRGPGGTFIQPDHFVPIAERYGLMPQIDRWVFDAVLRELRQRPIVRIFANLSAMSLNDEALLRYIEEQTAAAQLEPGRLAFEITESAAVADLASARNWIHRLKQLGCLFALDDFGVGFSSLGYLRALAVDYVKIDRTFIRDLDTNPTNRALVQAVNTVAHTLGKEVIAEGVETAAHAAVLLELGVEHGQGFHWGHPAHDAMDTQSSALSPQSSLVGPSTGDIPRY